MKGRYTLDRLATFNLVSPLAFLHQISLSLFDKCDLPCSFLCWEDLVQVVSSRFKRKPLRDLVVRLMLAAIYSISHL